MTQRVEVLATMPGDLGSIPGDQRTVIPTR